MRRLFTTPEARAAGLTPSELRWGERTGRWRRVMRGVYAEGPEPVTPLELEVAAVLRAHGVASGGVAAVLHRLDAVPLRTPGVRRRVLPADRIAVIEGVRCTDGVQTLVDLALVLDDLVWEQALESALRRELVKVEHLARVRGRGSARIRRVLALRPPGAPATESLLETLMVQLIRTVPGLPTPERQVEVPAARARVDLAWRDLGVFFELDGQHHLGQPEYDARRETAVVAATGWLCCRFTWREVVHTRAATRRRVAAIAEQARRRPPAA